MLIYEESNEVFIPYLTVDFWTILVSDIKFLTMTLLKFMNRLSYTSNYKCLLEYFSNETMYKKHTCALPYLAKVAPCT